jgi:UDP-glucose 4-epimerase
MKILITGGNGFIARNLFEQLSQEYTILAPNRHELDLLDFNKVAEYLKKNKFDVVIHTATYDAAPKHSTKDPAKVLENNLKMFFNVARCSKYFGKMIYFGSGAEFSREHWIPKMKESYFDTHVPADQYGFSKYVMAKYALSSKNIYNLRLFAVFGKYEDWRVRLVSSLCSSAVSSSPLVINQNKSYDFMHIDDLARIVHWFIENNPKNKIYNVCSGSTIDFETIAKKILVISGKKLPMEIKTPGFGLEYSGDNSLLLKEIKNFKFTPLDKSIQELYCWYSKNKFEGDR